ncbi:MAG: UDP-N-acetylmuramate dehydrogenase [Deltaproteobacteria bacterium]|nr:UDP-N-acetylmuramate dehydrogenase [Deltaproteobacteria bacterium]
MSEALVRDAVKKLRAGGITWLREKEPMSRHTTMRAGGAADCFILVRSADELIECLRVLSETGIKFFFMGAGSNLIVSDEGFDGAIIKGGGEFDRIEPCGEHCGEGEACVSAGSSAKLSALLRFARKNSLSGCAFLHGIPGTVGGAIKMNAGTAYGEIGGIVKSIELVNGGLALRHIEREHAGFGYRSSSIPDDAFVTKAVLVLKKSGGGDDEIIKSLEEKRGLQPKGFSNAGSIFKNPPSGESAGALIDKAGLKGSRIGGAMVSESHGNFIVNTGGARAGDILRLLIRIREEIFRRTNIMLETEVRIIGRGSLVKEAVGAVSNRDGDKIR